MKPYPESLKNKHTRLSPKKKKNSFLQPKKKKKHFYLLFLKWQNIFHKERFRNDMYGIRKKIFFFEKFYFENWKKKKRWLKRFSFTWHLRSWVQTLKRWVATCRSNSGLSIGPPKSKWNLSVMDICTLVSRMIDGPWNLES